MQLIKDHVHGRIGELAGINDLSCRGAVRAVRRACRASCVPCVDAQCHFFQKVHHMTGVLFGIFRSLFHTFCPPMHLSTAIPPDKYLFAEGEGR